VKNKVSAISKYYDEPSSTYSKRNNSLGVELSDDGKYDSGQRDE